MAPRKWDAFKGLNITSRDSDGMTCVGTNRYGQRCRWDISSASFNKIRDLLNALEAQPPNEALDSLYGLAGLCLCQNFHQDQAYQMVDKWETAIMEAAEEFKKRMGLKKKVCVLEERLEKEKVKTQKLQKKVEELQGQVLRATDFETVRSFDRRRTIEMETALKTIGEKYEDQLEALSKIAQQKYEDQEKQTEEYRRAFCASERQVTRLKKEKMEISHQLSVEKEALELAMKQCEEYLAASSRLANDLSAQSAETGELLLQKSETIKKIAAQRDDFHAQVTTLEQLQNQMEQDVERSTTDRTELSMQVEDLTRDLDLESKTSSKLQSELLQTQIHRDTLSQEVDDLRLELDVERKRSFEVVLQFEQAKATHTTINKEIKIVQSQLESEHQKSQKVTTMMEQLRTDLATLSVETEKLRSDLLSAHQTSEQIRQELHIAKETLSNTEVALGGVQARLEHCQSYDEFKTTAARREEENSASITELTDRIDFFRNHPFKTFFMSIIDIFKGWMNGAIRDIGNPGFSNRQLDANDENSAA